jgi:hypothetical protein
MGNSFIFIKETDLTTLCAYRRVIGLGANSNSPKTLMALSLLTQWLNYAFLYLKHSLLYLSQERSLKRETDTYSSGLYFPSNDEGSAEKFVLFFHQQQKQQAGISVDIRTLAGHFLCMDNDNKYVVANSAEEPYDKFLIVPVLDG